MVSINHDSALTPRSLRDTRRMNMFVSVSAAVAGLLFGLDIGVIAGALPFITDHFVLTSRLQEWVVSSMMLGAAIGALFNGWLSFRLGRKYSLMAGAILFVVGSLGSAFASSVEVLIGARVILGVAVGIASYTAPLYLSEMASENVRGNQYVSIDGDVGHCAGFFIRYGVQLQRQLARNAGRAGAACGIANYSGGIPA